MRMHMGYDSSAQGFNAIFWYLFSRSALGTELLRKVSHVGFAIMSKLRKETSLCIAMMKTKCTRI